jgi:hypothetical protein
MLLKTIPIAIETSAVYGSDLAGLEHRGLVSGFRYGAAQGVLPCAGCVVVRAWQQAFALPHLAVTGVGGTAGLR